MSKRTRAGVVLPGLIDVVTGANGGQNNLAACTRAAVRGGFVAVADAPSRFLGARAANDLEASARVRRGARRGALASARAGRGELA